MSIRFTTLALLLAFIASAGIPGQVGRLRLLAEIDPQPNFLLSVESRAVMSEDGRFVFLGSDNSGLSSSRQILSALVIPGVARLNPRLSTGNENVLQWALSPDGTRLAALSLGGTDRLRIYDVNPLTGSLTFSAQSTIPGNVLPSQPPVFSPRGDLIYICDTNDLNVMDAEPPLDPSPVQEFAYPSLLRGDRIAISESGNRLVLPLFTTSIAATDELVVYDINPITGLLTERSRWNPPGDPNWINYSNAVLSPNGSFAYVVNRVGETVVSLDLQAAGSVNILDTVPTASGPTTLTISETGNILANVCADEVRLFEIDDGVAQALGSFDPPASFATHNNVALSRAGTSGAIASFNDQRIFTFPVEAGANTQKFQSTTTEMAPGAISVAFDDRRLLVHMQDSLGTDGDRAELYQIQFSTPSLVETAAVSASPPIDITEQNQVVMSPSGNFAHHTTGQSFATIDTDVRGDSLPFLLRDPVGGRQVSISEDGSTAAIISGSNEISIYRSLAMSAPTASSFIAVSESARMAITSDGRWVYVPRQDQPEIHVLDADFSGVITNPLVEPISNEPVALTLSLDNSLLAVTQPNASPEALVTIYDVAGVDGSLSNRRTFNPPMASTMSERCPVIFSPNGNIALIGDDAGTLHLFDTAQAGGGFTNALSIGSTISSLTAIPGEDRVVALDPIGGRATVVDYSEPQQLVVLGGFDAAVLQPTSDAVVTSDGVFALIPNSSPSVGAGIDVINTRQIGFTFNAAARAETGTTVNLDIDDEGFRVVSLDTISDRAIVHNLTRLQPPRLARAILIEDSGTPNGVGEEDEFLLLTFERPVRTESFFVDDFDFRLTDGGSLGTGALIGTVGSSMNAALLRLGTGTTGIVAAGEVQGIDIPAFTSDPLIRALVDDFPAVDLGQPNFNDAGVDIARQPRRVGRLIQALSGGVVDYSDEPDAAFGGHTLTIPAGSLSTDTDFTIEPPSLKEGTAAFANAVRFTSSAGNPQSLFNLPAILTLEVDPTAVALETGQLPHLVGIVQLNMVSGEVVATPLPGPFSYSRKAQTVSTPIDGFNPTGSRELMGITPDAEGAGTYATIPVNPVDERSIYIGQQGARATGANPNADAVLTVGDAGAYTLHAIEFPGYEVTNQSDPNRIEVTVRTSTIFERVSLTGGQSFPQQSGAIFTIDVDDADGDPMAFTDPVNITVQFIDRENNRETDLIDFDSTVGPSSKMRLVWDADAGSGVDFQILAGSPSGGVVIQSGVTNLTGASGSRTFGAVIDPSATEGPSGLITR